MNTTFTKVLLGCASLILTACSLTIDGNKNVTNPPKPPVIVENAQEVTKNPQQSMETPNDQNTLQTVNLGSTPVSDAPVGGSIEKSMDPDDKLKMSRALDKAPGKTTSWTNSRTGTKYDVTPIRKVVLKDNPFCRTYQMIATRGGHTSEVSGTACISEDGAWHPV